MIWRKTRTDPGNVSRNIHEHFERLWINEADINGYQSRKVAGFEVEVGHDFEGEPADLPLANNFRKHLTGHISRRKMEERLSLRRTDKCPPSTSPLSEEPAALQEGFEMMCPVLGDEINGDTEMRLVRHVVNGRIHASIRPSTIEHATKAVSEVLLSAGSERCIVIRSDNEITRFAWVNGDLHDRQQQPTNFTSVATSDALQSWNSISEIAVVVVCKRLKKGKQFDVAKGRKSANHISVASVKLKQRRECAGHCDAQAATL